MFHPIVLEWCSIHFKNDSPFKPEVRCINIKRTHGLSESSRRKGLKGIGRMEGVDCGFRGQKTQVCGRHSKALDRKLLKHPSRSWLFMKATNLPPEGAWVSEECARSWGSKGQLAPLTLVTRSHKKETSGEKMASSFLWDAILEFYIACLSISRHIMLHRYSTSKRELQILSQPCIRGWWNS